MDISNLRFRDVLNLIVTKAQEILNMGKIDISNISKAVISTFLIFSITCIILWLIKGIGLYTMAKNRNDKYSFLAFIPYACLYTKGKIVGKTKLFGIEIEHTEFVLPIILISTMFPYTCAISFFLFIFAYYGILYRLYQEQIPNSAIVLLILSILFPVLQPFFIFFIRNKNTSNSKKLKD